jgi:H+-translocating NAD(P) transhydrogenase subunit alpha
MTIGILGEPEGENRVSLLAEAVAQLVKKNHEVKVAAGAGVHAFASNDDYLSAGAAIVPATEAAAADVVLSIHAPQVPLAPGTVLIGVYQPLAHAAGMQRWADQNVTAFSLDMLPRTTRAQSMDVLSSQANIAGYKAVLLAAHFWLPACCRRWQPQGL